MKIKGAYAINKRNEFYDNKYTSILLEISYRSDLDKSIIYKLHGFNIYSKNFYYIHYNTFEDLKKADKGKFRGLKVIDIKIPDGVYNIAFNRRFNCNYGFKKLSILEQELFGLRLIEQLK